MLNHEELMEQWGLDSAIEQGSLMSTMYGHPMLHSKYLTFLQGYKTSLRRKTQSYAKMKSLKTRYYNGELTKEELEERGWLQYLFKKPLKSEMESLLNADSDLQRIETEALYLQDLVSACEFIMKDISNRYFLFRSMVDYEKFQAGV